MSAHRIPCRSGLTVVRLLMIVVLGIALLGIVIGALLIIVLRIPSLLGVVVASLWVSILLLIGRIGRC